MTTQIEKRYALLLSGGINSWNNFPRYLNDLRLMYGTLAQITTSFCIISLQRYAAQLRMANLLCITALFSLPSSMRQLMIFNQSIRSTLTLLASGKQ
jgi:hypothetical protein